MATAPPVPEREATRELRERLEAQRQIIEALPSQIDEATAKGDFALADQLCVRAGKFAEEAKKTAANWEANKQGDIVAAATAPAAAAQPAHHIEQEPAPLEGEVPEAVPREPGPARIYVALDALGASVARAQKLIQADKEARGLK